MPARTILLNPGPVNISERVRRALLREDICHREEEFARLQASIRARLLQAFAPSGFSSVLVTGSGTAALESAVSSSVEEGRAILVVANGVYGERMAHMARTHGIRVVESKTDWRQPPDLADVERHLAADRGIQAVAAVHHETTTGLLNPIPALGRLARSAGKSFLVDSISGLGGDALDLEAACVDICVGTANKCIQGVPGIAFVLVRSTEMERLTTIPTRTVYFHLPAHWAAQEKGEPLFTPAIQVGYALDEALHELLDEGVTNRITRYAAAAAFLRAGFEELRLRFLLPPEWRSNTITSLELPGVPYLALHDALRAHGFVIYAGQGALAARIFRVANMGDVSEAEYREFLGALGKVLAAIGAR